MSDGNTLLHSPTMDSKTFELLRQWRDTLSEKEKQLHELAALKLKKVLVPKNIEKDTDSGSYFPERCHAFLKWRKSNKL